MVFRAHERAKEFLRAAAREPVDPDAPSYLPEPEYHGWPMVGAFHLPRYRKVRKEKR